MACNIFFDHVGGHEKILKLPFDCQFDQCDCYAQGRHITPEFEREGRQRREDLYEGLDLTVDSKRGWRRPGLDFFHGRDEESYQMV